MKSIFQFGANEETKDVSTKGGDEEIDSFDEEEDWNQTKYDQQHMKEMNKEQF